MGISIEQSLRERFAAPLPDYYRRRIIFWQDPDGEFAGQVDDLCPESVKLLKLTGTNNFEAKLLLSETDTDSDYLVYNPIGYASVQDDWLLDIELYSEEFRADLLSIRMQALHMPPTVPLRKAMRAYHKFFESKERVSKLAALQSDYTSPGQLHIDVMAVLSGTSANTAPGVIRAVLMAGLDMENNAALANIWKFGSEAAFWELVSRYTGYAAPEPSSLTELAAHILFTALSATMDAACLQGLENLISAPHQSLCYALVSDWMHSEEDDALYDIARTVEEAYHLAERFDRLEVGALMNSECFPCINECILRRYMTEISDNVIKADDIVAAVEKRRTLKWYKRIRYYYDALLQVARMQQFYQSHAAGFRIAEYEKLWKEYCADYCKMDHFYRLFHAAFDKGLKETSTVLEDLFKNVADYVEKLYKNWYLSELGQQWTRLIGEELAGDARLPGIAQQADFYRNYVRPIIAGGSRAYVIISDALRYEVGVELTGELLRNTKGTAKISAMQATFPTATKFGMAALLPHQMLQMTQNAAIQCDGLPTDSTENRQTILKKAHDGNVAVTYKALISMKQPERRAAVSRANVVYIYHNVIDAAGDKASTEDQVFAACDQAVTELKNLVRLITNDLGGSSILITADHGFLYSYKPLEESDKVEKSFLSGQIIELGRRYVIASGECAAEHMLKIPMTHLNSSFSGFAPLTNLRIKKAGGGMNYVHGGISLQEMAVPVVEFKNIRANSKKYVETRPAELQLISQSRKVSNSIFSLDFYQKDVVGGKITDAVYEVFMADEAGRAVSDKRTVVADKTSTNGAERVFRVRFTLKGMEFKKTDTYYLTIADKNASGAAERIVFTIDIAFVNDFDF